ncbi:MAG: hypothetical protein RLZZ447_1800, partial [Verrucomicrobiota bacterium]
MTWSDARWRARGAWPALVLLLGGCT